MHGYRRAQIVAGLEAEGLVFRTFTIGHDSPHAVADWDWNQRDLPHIPHIHGGFRLVPLVVGDDLASGLFVQKLLGFSLPLGVTYHHASASTRVYTTTLGPLALVVEASLEAIATGSRVTTVYSLGIRPALRLILPAAEWFLRRNYAQVRDEDEPLRVRRTELRRWGYRFDDHGSYQRSLDLSTGKIKHPNVSPQRVELTLGDVLVGRADHLGLRVISTPDAWLVFPRMCEHQGASLDTCALQGSTLTCPWHGRQIACVARFDRSDRSQRAQILEHHRLTRHGHRLLVEPL